MVTDDYLLDDLERSQLNATRRRRANRSRRYYQMLFVAMGFLALSVLAAPSIVSHTGIAKSMLASAAAEYGWEASAGSVDVGWITPLTLRDLELVGASGETTLRVDRVITALTVTQLLRFDPANTGEVSLRGVEVACTVDEGYSSLESDLAIWLETDPQSDTAMTRADVQIQDVSATLLDRSEQRSWVLNQSNLHVTIDGERVSADIAGVLREPDGDEGALQSRFAWNDASNPTQWELTAETESFPLSITELLARRFAQSVEGLPHHFAGDTTGRIELVGRSDGSIEADLGDIRIRNLQTIVDVESQATRSRTETPPKTKQWNNQLATLNGRLVLSQNRLAGQDLQLTTDFGSAAIDGSFPTTISLVGSEDNPIRWLQALNGKAEVDVDLAALDHALPGLIPLRDNATLVSGRARGGIDNTPGASGDSGSPASMLTLSSDSLRARADGRMVVIEPITVTALVREVNGKLRAEKFDFASVFGNASGRGTLESGSATFEIDFGRLYSMLRPVIDLSELSLGGTAGGDVRWAVTADQGFDRWELGGSGQADNLLVTLPDGQRFKRSIVQGELSAGGHWNGQTLQELTAAKITLRSSGVVAAVELTEPVKNPSEQSMYPIRLQADGRLEHLNESLRPWLPDTLVQAEGRITGWVIARVGRDRGTLSQADFVLHQPRFNYAGQWFSQPKLDVKFNGIADWPSGNFSSQESTLVGESISLAIRGEASREKTNLDIAWEADLEGMQKSLGSTLARAASLPQTRPISFRASQTQSYQYGGRCKGNVTLTDQPQDVWKIDTTCSITNLAIYEPGNVQAVPPGTTFGSGFGVSATNPNRVPMWFEPRIKLNGPVLYHPPSKGWNTPGLQLASDWFAGTLSGTVKDENGQQSLQLAGPARWKMDLVAQRLMRGLGIRVSATGLHEGEIDFRMTSQPDKPTSFTASTTIGWDHCDVEGVRFAAATLPLTLTEQSLSVANTTLPIVSVLETTVPRANPIAKAVVAAEVDYTATPMVVRMEPGSKIQSLQITPAAAATWLKYLAPLAAGATAIDGTLNANFDQLELVPSDPDASIIRGTLNIEQMRLSSGPIANQLIQGVRQIKSLARMAGGQAETVAPQTWIEMPPQSVEFSFENGIVTHHRMFFNIDRASLMTSGRVGTDSRINLVAQVPLDARWLGNDLQGLAGQTITLPITGTLSRPSLDDSAVRNVVRELGTKASAEVIQNRLDGLLRKELGSSLDQLNTGLEKILGF